MYGNLTLKIVNGTTVKILPDYYNFEQHLVPNFWRHPIKAIETIYRNTLTSIGSVAAGNGIPYSIYFNGTTTIHP